MSLKFISDIHTASKLQRLLVLESEHGPLPGKSPALPTVLHYLNQVLHCCIRVHCIVEGTFVNDTIIIFIDCDSCLHCELLIFVLRMFSTSLYGVTIIIIIIKKSRNT